MIKLITLMFVVLVTSGQVSAYEVDTTQYGKQARNSFAATADSVVSGRELPEFWVSYQWDDSPTYADRLSEDRVVSSTFSRSIAEVPEPGTITLLTLGIVGLLLRRKISR